MHAAYSMVTAKVEHSKSEILQSLHGKVITFLIKFGMQLLVHSKTLTVRSLKFEIGKVILKHI